MHQSVADLLIEKGIRLRDYRPGQHVTTCPECSAGRRKKRDTCLSVKIDERGGQFYCHHCGWHGGVYLEAQRVGGSVRQGRPENKPVDFGSAQRRLRNNVLS